MGRQSFGEADLQRAKELRKPTASNKRVHASLYRFSVHWKKHLLHAVGFSNSTATRGPAARDSKAGVKSAMPEDDPRRLKPELPADLSSCPRPAIAVVFRQNEHDNLISLFFKI